MRSLPKFLVIILSALLVLGLAVGILYLFREKIPFLAPILAPGREEITLTYWGLFEPEEVIEPLIAKYQEEHPNVTINYQLQSYPTFARYKETLYARLGQEGGGPDIARVHATWIPQLASRLSPLPSSVIPPSEFGETFYPVVKDLCQAQGSIYCLPLMYDGLVLLYNKDLFREAAISAPPQTWREFREVAVKLSQWEDNDPKGKILQAGAAIGAASNINYASDILGLMLSQSEVNIPQQLSSQAAEDVFAFYTNFVRKDHVWDETLPSEVSAFLSGKVGMIFVPSWEIARLRQASLNFDFGVAAVPQVPKLEGGLTDVGWSNFWVEAVSSSSPHPEEAWKFLKFLSEQESQKELFDRAVQIRGAAFPYARRDLRSLLSQDKNFGPVVKWAANSEASPINSCSGNADYEAVITEAVSEILSGKQISSVLRKAEKTLSSLVESRSLGLEKEERTCALASFGLGVPEVEEPKPESKPKKPEPEEAEEPLRCLQLSAVPSSGEIPLKVTFSARPSDFSRAKSYRFAFGDGTVEEESSSRVTHTYAQAGTYTASVRIEDSEGKLTPETSFCQATISARRPTIAEASPTAKPETGIALPMVLVIGFGVLLLAFGFFL